MSQEWEEKGVLFFESKHSIGLLIFIAENEGCTKSEIFDRYSEDQSAASMLRRLEQEELVGSVAADKGTAFSLTEKGKEVYRMFKSIERLL